MCIESWAGADKPIVIDDIVNGQGQSPFADIPFANTTVEAAGCAPIAVHNAMILIGQYSNLYDVLDYFADRHSVRNLGCMPWEISGYLKKHGIEYSGSLSPSIIDSTKDGGVAIVTFWTGTVSVPIYAPCYAGGVYITSVTLPNFSKPAHTVAITYENGRYIIYNYVNGDNNSHSTSSYSSYIGGGFIYGYYIPG